MKIAVVKNVNVPVVFMLTYFFLSILEIPYSIYFQLCMGTKCIACVKGLLLFLQLFFCLSFFLISVVQKKKKKKNHLVIPLP